MAIWDFRPKGDVLTGVAVGVGLLAAPVVAPLAWSAVRPLLKAVLKGSFMLYETGRGVFGEAATGADETNPAKAVKIKRAVAPLSVTHQAEQALAPKSGDVEAGTSKQVKQKPANEKPKRSARPGKKKPEKERMS